MNVYRQKGRGKDRCAKSDLLGELSRESFFCSKTCFVKFLDKVVKSSKVLFNAVLLKDENMREQKGFIFVIIKAMVLCGIISALSNCGGHYRYCVESAHFDAATESKSLTRENK